MSEIIDDDKILTIPGAIDAFGLHDSVWRTACREGTLKATRRHRKGWQFRAGDARAFARAYATDVPTEPPPDPPRPQPKESQ